MTAILELPMPNACNVCPLYWHGNSVYYCWGNDTERTPKIDHCKQRAEGCPLKEKE